ncbi:hypothetical protein V5785_02125 [Bacillus subtilis]
MAYYIVASRIQEGSFSLKALMNRSKRSALYPIAVHQTAMAEKGHATARKLLQNGIHNQLKDIRAV